MNINPNRHLESSVIGNNVTVSGILAVNNVTVTGNIDATTTAKTVAVDSLVTKDYITLPTTSTAAPAIGKLGYLVRYIGPATTGLTSGNYITGTGSATALTAGLWIVFGTTTFTFTTPTSLTKIGIQLTGSNHGNVATLSNLKGNAQSVIEYGTAITPNIPSKININRPSYYHHATTATSGSPIYLSMVSVLQAIRIA